MRLPTPKPSHRARLFARLPAYSDHRNTFVDAASPKPVTTAAGLSDSPPTGAAPMPAVPLAHPMDEGTGVRTAGQRSKGNPISPSQPPPHIPGHELIRCIGRGAYGEVWLARNTLGTLRAVKIVHRQPGEEDLLFDREFKGLQAAEPVSRSHEGVVDILQVGRDDHAGHFFYVMELADDATVAADVRRLTSPGARVSPPAAGSANQNDPPVSWRLASGLAAAAGDSRAPQSEPPYVGCYQPRTLHSDLKHHGALPFTDCLGIAAKLASALDYLHTHGLVHRDIKPSNIIFVQGEPKLADVGLVANLDDARSLVGTAGYIAPEGPGTPQADLFSLGKVLYEMAFGKHRQEFPQLPADLPSRPDHVRLLELNEIILQACESDRRHRYASAQEMRRDLELLQRGKSVKRARLHER